MFTNPEMPRYPVQLEDDPDTRHPIYDLSFDNDLWQQRILIENAYSHAYTRRFGVPPTGREAFNMSYQIQVLKELLNARLAGFQDGLEGRFNKLQGELEKFIENEFLKDDALDE